MDGTPFDTARVPFAADEIDAIAGKRESAQREMERRIVAQMLTCMDDLASPVSGGNAELKSTEDGKATGDPADAPSRHVLVIGVAQLRFEAPHDTCLEVGKDRLDTAMALSSSHLLMIWLVSFQADADSNIVTNPQKSRPSCSSAVCRSRRTFLA